MKYVCAGMAGIVMMCAFFALLGGLWDLLRKVMVVRKRHEKEGVVIMSQPRR